MKLNNLFIALIFLIVLLSQIQLGSSYFTKSHIAWVVDGFNSVSSPLVAKCKPYLADVLDGNSGADAGVIYYGNSDKQLIGSYIGMHTDSSGYETCKLNAKNDRQICKCVGDALHIIEDAPSHLKDGLVEVYLKKYFGSNYYGHMTVEKSFENKHMTYLASINDYSISSGQEDYYNRIVMDTFFIKQPDGSLVPSEDMQLLNKMAGIDMENSVKIFRSGYQGEGFYNTVYKDKVTLPFWMRGISYGIVLVGFVFFFFILYVGTTRWKYATSLIFLFIGLVGLLLLYSFNPNPFNIFGESGLWGLTHFELSSWQIVTYLIEIPSAIPGWAMFLGLTLIGLIPMWLLRKSEDGKYFKWIFLLILMGFGIGLWSIMGNSGYLQVSDSDVIYYHNLVQKATNDFLATEQLNIEDASGLSYTNSNGVYVTGALTQAEMPFKWISYAIVLPLSGLFLLYMILKSLGIRFRRK